MNLFQIKGVGENKKVLAMTAAQFYEKKELLREKIVRYVRFIFVNYNLKTDLNYKL